MPDITIKALDGPSFGGYAAFPPEGHGPGLIVIPDMFGVNATMRSLCDAFAAEGYMAVCPDVFWRQEPGMQINDRDASGWARAEALAAAFDVEAGVRDLLATLAYVRGQPACSGKIGAVGCGLGGKLAWLMAARSDVDCAVGANAADLGPVSHEVHDVRVPLLLPFSDSDARVPAPALKKAVAVAAHNPCITAFVASGAGPSGAAVLADGQAAAFLAEHLLKG